MLYEYAIEPKALASWNPLWQALEQFGISHGRMISEFPKHWTQLVYTATANCLPRERSMLEIRLNKLKSKLMKSRRGYDTPHWRDNASQQMAVKPFQAVIQKDNPTNEEFILTEMDLHAGTARWNVPTQRIVPREGPEMAACIGGLCRVSRELLFVDPHFSSESRFTSVLPEFIRAAHEHGQSFRRIELHTGARISRQFLETQCRRWIAPQLPSGIAIHFFQWCERTPGKKLHARYVLTEKGGIRFDVGLDSGEPGQTTDVSLLNEILHQQRWADFQPGSKAFDRVDDFTIVGV